VYTQTPFFVRFRSSRFAPSAGVSWLWLVPGISLIVLALAIVLWPDRLFSGRGHYDGWPRLDWLGLGHAPSNSPPSATG
jgi:hypothetical protein